VRPIERPTISVIVVYRESGKDGVYYNGLPNIRCWGAGAKGEALAKSVLTVSKVEKLDVDYDEEADVLYISFGPPVAASDSRTLENDIIVRYKGERIIGITVPSLRKRLKHT